MQIRGSHQLTSDGRERLPPSPCCSRHLCKTLACVVLLLVLAAPSFWIASCCASCARGRMLHSHVSCGFDISASPFVSRLGKRKMGHPSSCFLSDLVRVLGLFC
ncbi:hypothetical protein NL676_001516 [Syzygium grande]|nr:hypothetical protein NL676_001516 [Syzygium grande]